MRFCKAIILTMFLGVVATGPEAKSGLIDHGRDVKPSLDSIRAHGKLKKLKVNQRLTRAASAHANDMQRRNFFDHKSSDGSGVGDRVRRQGYRFCFVAENIAQGQRNLETVMKAWMNSPKHRQNILNRKVTEYGLVRGPNDIWVMVLGRPGC